MISKISDIYIRPMKSEHVDDIVILEAAAYGNHHWSKESFLNEIQNELAHYWCAFDSCENLLGYAGCWQILEEAHITTVAVSPEFRRNKIGEALLKTIIDDCYKNMIKYITLEVRVSNTAAINLYEKYGFKSLGTRKGYYQDNNEDALIMWTENIFYDKFKLLYDENIKYLAEKVEIKCPV